AIALAWELKGSCKGCAHSLLATAKWLVPEAERFLVLRTGSYSHQRRRVIPVTLVSICCLIFGFVSGLIVFPDPPRQGIEITQNEYGKRWPFAAPQGQLRCEGRGAIILTVRGIDYAVNGMAATRYASVLAIWKKGGDATDIGPIISRGLTLCKW
ncbi:MAG TPA: DUF2511 domain-containing protein, partial [Pyrinomonadaceae bacterium]|nr:DUF2511 domain-containing protein [Pyrinomonadaceae bacterium]